MTWYPYGYGYIMVDTERKHWILNKTYMYWVKCTSMTHQMLCMSSVKNVQYKNTILFRDLILEGGLPTM